MWQTVLATMVLGQETLSDDKFGGLAPILLPMMIAATGIIFSIIATFFVKINDKAGIHNAVVQKALNMGNWGLYNFIGTGKCWVGILYSS